MMQTAISAHASISIVQYSERFPIDLRSAGLPAKTANIKKKLRMTEAIRIAQTVIERWFTSEWLIDFVGM